MNALGWSHLSSHPVKRIFPPREEDHERSWGDLTILCLPAQDVLLGELIVGVVRRLVADVDHDGGDHALLGRITRDGLRVAGDEAVRRVHVSRAVFADGELAQVVAVLRPRGHNLEYDMGVTRP